jgi:hypothetical protein
MHVVMLFWLKVILKLALKVVENPFCVSCGGNDPHFTVMMVFKKATLVVLMVMKNPQTCSP